MPANAVTYAEDELQVHTVWEQAQSRMQDLHQALKASAEIVTAIRDTKDKLADREREIVTTTRGAFHELSETAWSKKLKELVHDDPTSKDLRDLLRGHEAAHDEAEADVKYHTQGVQLYQARMIELGGLLNFYAATKRTA